MHALHKRQSRSPRMTQQLKMYGVASGSGISVRSVESTRRSTIPEKDPGPLHVDGSEQKFTPSISKMGSNNRTVSPRVVLQPGIPLQHFEPACISPRLGQGMLLNDPTRATSGTDIRKIGCTTDQGSSNCANMALSNLVVQFDVTRRGYGNSPSRGNTYPTSIATALSEARPAWSNSWASLLNGIQGPTDVDQRQ
ncbi:hypothetical protein SARC_03713 [Sphaeroforma arctica JP610]|uniref:Uncharacterized protein n=1 Tax=Sphaeroforma arctica JP610 TaxID=667725 RepID=A0A0L0G5F8_9EUKA|nr:hypothetical protein SARC_03713 [Sphaeroforma arctica JP610]KNC84051.1 hypothetical protein SARC_03713 [Sphaeroforma arctica JP610]|eukprot:XP_014157953.1 hypothetical protein SARC_03713 [Sphaeroforma arctica JP610]